MYVTLKFKPRKGFNNVMKHLEKVNGTSAEWGVYRESGMHPEAEMTYSALMAIHELREDKWRRPVFALSAQRYESQYFKTLSRTMEDYITRAARGKHIGIDKVHKPVAEQGANNAIKIFGNKKLLVPNTSSTVARKGHDKPMIELGRLKSVVKFKVKKRGE